MYAIRSYYVPRDALLMAAEHFIEREGLFVVEEKIGHDAGADSPQSLSKEHLCTLIRKAGKAPFERDTLYNELSTSPEKTC